MCTVKSNTRLTLLEHVEAVVATVNDEPNPVLAHGDAVGVVELPPASTTRAERVDETSRRSENGHSVVLSLRQVDHVLRVDEDAIRGMQLPPLLAKSPKLSQEPAIAGEHLHTMVLRVGEV